MRLQRPPLPPAAAIALTPLVDIVIILLIFFMLASRFDLWTGFDLRLAPVRSEAVNPPRSTDIRKKNERSVIDIVLMRGGWVSIDGRPVEPAEKRGFLTGIKNSMTDRAVAFSVHAEEGVEVAALVALLDDLKDAGATDIRLAPDRDRGAAGRRP